MLVTTGIQPAQLIVSRQAIERTFPFKQVGIGQPRQRLADTDQANLAGTGQKYPNQHPIAATVTSEYRARVRVSPCLQQSGMVDHGDIGQGNWMPLAVFMVRMDHRGKLITMVPNRLPVTRTRAPQVAKSRIRDLL